MKMRERRRKGVRRAREYMYSCILKVFPAF